MPTLKHCDAITIWGPAPAQALTVAVEVAAGSGAVDVVADGVVVGSATPGGGPTVVPIANGQHVELHYRDVLNSTMDVTYTVV